MMAVRFETTPERSRNMAKIKSHDTKPEILLRTALWSAGLRGWRKNLKGVPGTPDVAFTRYKLAVFVDGDFWHGRDFESRKTRLAAGNNGSYWVQKIEANLARDARQMAELERLGWVTLRFWSRDVTRDPDACATEVKRKLEELKKNHSREVL